jgi:hypothetical protein
MNDLPRNWLDEYWGNVAQGGGAPARPHGKPHNAAADRVRALAEQQRGRQQALMDGLRNKILYANVMGVPDKSLIPMGELSKIGIEAQRTPQGIPYGIDPKSLNQDERELLGLSSSLDGLYGGT